MSPSGAVSRQDASSARFSVVAAAPPALPPSIAIVRAYSPIERPWYASGSSGGSEKSTVRSPPEETTELSKRRGTPLWMKRRV